MVSATGLLITILLDYLPRFVLLSLYTAQKFLDHPVPLADLPVEALVDAIRWSNKTNQWCPFSLQTPFRLCQTGGVVTIHGQQESHYSLPPMRAGTEDVGRDSERPLVVSGMDSMEFIEEKMDYVSAKPPPIPPTVPCVSNPMTITHPRPLKITARIEELSTTSGLLPLIAEHLHNQVRCGWLDEVLVALLPDLSHSLRYVALLMVTLATLNMVNRPDSLVGRGVPVGKRRANLFLLVMGLMFAPSHNSPLPTTVDYATTIPRRLRLYMGAVPEELLFLHTLLLCGLIDAVTGAISRKFTAFTSLAAGERSSRDPVEERLRLLVFLAIPLFSMVAALAALVLVASDYEAVLSVGYKGVMVAGVSDFNNSNFNLNLKPLAPSRSSPHSSTHGCSPCRS